MQTFFFFFFNQHGNHHGQNQKTEDKLRTNICKSYDKRLISPAHKELSQVNGKKPGDHQENGRWLPVGR